MMRTLERFTVAVLLIFSSSLAFAVGELSQTFTLDGQLMLAGTTTVLSDAHAKVVVEILDPSLNCLLYEEQQYIDTTNSDGYFSIQVGSLTGAGKRTGLDPGRTMLQVYQNTVAIVAANAPTKTCAGLLYTPAANDGRVFRLIVTPTATGVPDTLSPDTVLDSVPTALVAQTLQGYSASQFLILGAGDLTQANLQTVFAAGNAAKMTSLLSVPAANYITKDATSGLIQVPSGSGTPAGVAAGQIWYDSGTLKYYDGSTVQPLTSGGLSGAGTAGYVPYYSAPSTLANSPLFVLSGAVGVGTATPSSLLEVSTSQNAATAITVGNANAGGSALAGLAAVSSAGTFALGINGAANQSGAAYVFNLANTDLKFGTNGSERMRIQAGGNIGIGTSGPFSPLHVASPFAKTNVARKEVMTLSTNDASNPFKLVVAVTGAASLVDRVFELQTSDDGVSNGGNLILQPGAGNVGIKTGTPRTALDVNGAIVSNLAVGVTSGSTVDFALNNLAYSTLDCKAYALWNLKDGGSYTLAVQGTASALCSFTAFSDGGSTPIATIKMPPDHGATTAGKQTLYTFIVMGSTVYVAWVPGY